ncbi:IclR family transcriptional regulator [Oleisolibacter albus]|uniref:IclR family transcriptional regulator n=1 Tax=Oleisolibacter albus TaxID=2171757 RepID=UPI00138FFB25|nr:IclR family transcriptional regulator [Oleisolibacter albus]
MDTEHNRTQDRAGIQVIERAAKVLNAVERSPEGLSLGEIAKEVDLARSTVQRIVAALTDVGFLIAASPSARVRLGPAILRLAASAETDVSKTLHPMLISLSKETEETVDLAMHRGADMVFMDQVQGRGRLVAISAVGERFPVHCTANGKAVLSLMPDNEARAVIEKSLRAHPDHPVKDMKKLLAEIEEAKESRLAYDRGEHAPDIGAVGIAICDPFGRYLAISIPAPIRRFSQKQRLYGELLLEYRARITKTLNC